MKPLPTSFDRVKRLASLLERSPMSADVGLPLSKIPDAAAGEVLPVLRAVQELLQDLNGFLVYARADAGSWLLESSDDYDHNYDSCCISPIKLLAERGVKEFLSLCNSSDEDVVRDFLTDIVRVEWQFCQLRAEKPEHDRAYCAQLRQAYSSIINKMKQELSYLPWAARSRVGAAVAA
jgi:hypothetical protein